MFRYKFSCFISRIQDGNLEAVQKLGFDLFGTKLVIAAVLPTLKTNALTFRM